MWLTVRGLLGPLGWSAAYAAGQELTAGDRDRRFDASTYGAVNGVNNNDSRIYVSLPAKQQLYYDTYEQERPARQQYRGKAQTTKILSLTV